MKISDPKDRGMQYPLRDLVKDIWQHSGKKKSSLVYGTIFRVISDIIQLYPTYALALIITKITNGTATKENILFIIFLCLMAYILRYFLVNLAKNRVYYTAHLVSRNVEKKMLEVLISKNSAWQETETSGVKLKRLEKGSSGYKDILYAYINTYIETFISLIGVPFILFKFEPIIGITTAIFIFIYFTISRYLQKVCLESAHLYNIEDEKLHGQVFETVNHIRTIHVLNIRAKVMEKVNTFIDSSLLAMRQRIRNFQFRSHFMNGFSQSFKVVVVLFITYSVLKGNYEVGFIVLFISYFEKIWEMIREVTDTSQDILVARQSIARMYDLMGRQVAKEQGSEDFPRNWSKLTVEKLSFFYGNNNVLKNITFNVKRGEKVGIVGLSGAGKSTLFKLLIKERDDYEGNIKIDNVSIKDIKKDEYYKKVSIVLQDTEVFNFSLKDNITISNTEKAQDQKHIDNAITVSHVRDFLPKLQHGIESLIGEKGIKLSGGERQRLGIARAIFKNPDILLLDEATSHLDLESEEKIKDSLQKFFKNVTAIVIAHRLTTIKEMDKIIVIEKGEIQEEGSFEELMNKKDRFYELWQKQLI